MPGLSLGSLLTLVLAVSSFITPKLLGGGRVFLLATEVYDQAIVTLDWPLAATLSMIVLVVFGIALIVVIVYAPEGLSGLIQRLLLPRRPKPSALVSCIYGGRVRRSH